MSFREKDGPQGRFGTRMAASKKRTQQLEFRQMVGGDSNWSPVGGANVKSHVLFRFVLRVHRSHSRDLVT